jgi:two-component system OmpR family sensor kinase
MGWTLTRRATAFARKYWVEIAWCGFVLLNVAAILVFPDWATVPFHFIWITLSLLYGWRVWGLRATGTALAAVIMITGVALLDDVILRYQAPDELTEIPLMAAVFVVMVMYVRRSVAAKEQIRRISEHKLAQERQFIEDASHVLRTPLTIALGHAELIKRTTTDPLAARDSEVVIDELHRLKMVSDRLLRLAATEQPDFVHPVETPIRELVKDASARWSSTCPAVELGRVADVSVPLDPARVLDALDELIGNAVGHTPPGTPVKLSARREDGCVVVAVADSGPGIPSSAQALVFDRFARVEGHDRRNSLGIGLAIVKAIAEAHGGSVTLRSEPGRGATFELRLPVAGAKHEQERQLEVQVP